MSKTFGCPCQKKTKKTKVTDCLNNVSNTVQSHCNAKFIDKNERGFVKINHIFIDEALKQFLYLITKNNLLKKKS